MDTKKSDHPLVLFADDDVNLHDLIQAALGRLDCEVDCFTNGADALAAYRKRHHDAIIVDLMMPNKNGYEFLRELKNIDPEARGRTIVLTGTGEETWGLFDRESVLAFFQKPIDLDRLISCVEECLEQARTVSTP